MSFTCHLRQKSGSQGFNISSNIYMMDAMYAISRISIIQTSLIRQCHPHLGSQYGWKALSLSFPKLFLLKIQISSFIPRFPEQRNIISLMISHEYMYHTLQNIHNHEKLQRFQTIRMAKIRITGHRLIEFPLNSKQNLADE